MGFLRLSALRKIYAGGTEAVAGIDLVCREGEFVVLLGPSGCGKTTTLRMIAGLEIPTEGRIEVGGEDITALPAAARDVGFVFQFYALYPHLRVRQNIAFPLESMGLPRSEREKQVDEIIQRLGLGELEGFFPQQLSGGDQQRVALARAMVRQPKLYLMDEPLGTLDADLRREMRVLIRSQQLEMGVTTLYVTHDQEEAMSLADRVVVMEAGKIRQSGPPAEVYDRPSDLFVAHFMGSPGMNFIEGEVRVEGGKTSFWDEQGGFSVDLGRPVPCGRAILGVRPEFVRPVGSGGLAGKVVLDEYLGDCRNIHLDTACGRLVMRAANGDIEERDQIIQLGFDADHLRIFAGDEGKSI